MLCAGDRLLSGKEWGFVMIVDRIFQRELVSHWKGTREEEGSFGGLPHGLLVGFDASLKVWYRRAVP